MLSSTFQTGYLSVFSSIGTDPLQIWGSNDKDGKIHLIKDSEIQSNVYELVGKNICNTFIYSPCDVSKKLGIKLPVIVLTVKNMKKAFSFEIQIKDDKEITRRFRASNYQATTRIKPYICTMPLHMDDGWNHIQVNLDDLCRQCYNTHLVETESIIVSSEEEWPMEFKIFIPTEEKRILV